MASQKSNAPISKVAVFSLIYGILAIPVLGLLFAGLAVIFGHVGLWKCKLSRFNPSPMRGRRAARIGLVLGYLCMILTPFFLIGGGVVAWTKKDEIRKIYEERDLEERTFRSYDSAARLYLACETYADKNKKQYPPAWDNLVGRYFTRNDLTQLLKSSHPRGVEKSFRMMPHERPVPLEFQTTTIVIQEIAPPNVAKVVVVYADGNSDLIDNPDID